jgi:hypothetical protein
VEPSNIKSDFSPGGGGPRRRRRRKEFNIPSYSPLLTRRFTTITSALGLLISTSINGSINGEILLRRGLEQ